LAKSGANGVVRNVHLKPRPVILAATESATRYGTPCRSATAVATSDTEE